MKQEDKNLLLKDLCAREPYHPRINVFNQGWEGFQDGEFDTDLWLHHLDAFRFDRIEIKPYLRPMSSMTKDEEQEFQSSCRIIGFYKDGEFACTFRGFDWLNAHHFDYRGLIEKGLALEAPSGMYE